MKKTLFLALSLILSATLIAQDEHRILTNADVLNMAKSGMSEKTILLLIQQSPAKFDTSPDALIELKKGGVSDEVLNAMLLAATSRNKTRMISLGQKEEGFPPQSVMACLSALTNRAA